jgi:hypothetical protein
LRKLGHGGSDVGTFTPGTTGSTRNDGCRVEYEIETVDVPLGGCVSLNDHTGCAPFGAAIVTRIRDPAR